MSDTPANWVLDCQTTSHRLLAQSRATRLRKESCVLVFSLGLIPVGTAHALSY